MSESQPNLVLPPPRSEWATVQRNSKFVAVDTWSGYRSSGLDDQGYHVVLPPEVGDEELGLAVQTALRGSRFLDLSEIGSFFDLNALKQRGEAQEARWMAYSGHKTRRALFKGMELCNVRYLESQIHLSPMRQERLDAWGGMGKDAHIVLPEAATAAELGSAVKLALDRSGGQ